MLQCQQHSLFSKSYEWQGSYTVGSFHKQKITLEEWNFIKLKLLEVIPALYRLEPRYNGNGFPTGYINGAGFLAFHESEIMLLVLETLREHHSIPAYPVHDCLLVKVSDWEQAYVTFVQTISTYVENLTA